MAVSVARRLKQSLRPWIPPAAIRIVDQLKRGRSGLGKRLGSWSEAVAASTGYDHDQIFDRVDAQARAVSVAGSGVERDGVVLKEVQVPFPLVACLLRAAIKGGARRLHVIDFGGALGSSYHQCKLMLAPIAHLDWRIVEQAGFVTRGRAFHVTESLTFHETLEAAAVPNRPDVILFSSVLHYLPDPGEILARAVALEPRAIIIDRTPVSALPSETFTIQYVPKDIYPARLPVRIFGVGQIDTLLAGYVRIVDFETVDPEMNVGSLLVKYRGALYESMN